MAKAPKNLKIFDLKHYTILNNINMESQLRSDETQTSFSLIFGFKSSNQKKKNASLE